MIVKTGKRAKDNKSRPKVEARRQSKRKQSLPRRSFVLFDRKTGWYLSERPYADGWDCGRENGYTLSRRDGALVFPSHEAALLAKFKVDDQFMYGGWRFHQFEIVVVGEEPMLDRESIPDLTDYGFPKEVKAYMLEGFMTTTNGWTKPKIGRLDGNGVMFVAKFASHTSLKHIQNECLTHNLYRHCGLNAPRSRIYRVRFRGGRVDHVLLSEYIEGKPLGEYLKSATKEELKHIGEEVLKSFPLDSFLNNYDAYNNDNSIVDREGLLWHIDNGSSLRFRATGGVMPWTVTASRTNPIDDRNGVYCMYNGDCRVKSPHLEAVFSNMTKKAIEGCWGRFGFRFVNLVRRFIPKVFRPPHINKYAQELDNIIRRNGGRIEVPSIVESAYRGDDEGKYDDFNWQR